MEPVTINGRRYAAWVRGSEQLFDFEAGRRAQAARSRFFR